MIGRDLMMTISPWDISTRRYVSAMAVRPSNAQIDVINNFIVGAKVSGFWQKTTWLSLLAGHDEQATLLNVVNPTQTFTAVNDPDFIVNEGWQGVTSTSGYLVTTQVSERWDALMPNEDCFHFCYISGGNDSDVDNSREAYGQDSGSGRNLLRPRITSNRISGLLNDANLFTSPNGVATTSYGLTLMNRTSGSDTITFYKDGVGHAALQTSPWDAPTSAQVKLFGTGSSGIITDYLMPVFGIGNDALTAQQAEDLYNLTQTYLSELAAL